MVRLPAVLVLTWGAIFLYAGSLFAESVAIAINKEVVEIETFEMLDAPVLSARDIMDKSYNVDTGDNVIQKIKMTAHNKKNGAFDKKYREYKITTFRKKAGDKLEDLSSIMFFTAPAKQKNIGFLIYDYDDGGKRDKLWTYSPALPKIRQIAVQSKSQPFMSSDFSYADLSARNTADYEYTLLKEDILKEQPVWVIEAKPINYIEVKETGYIRILNYVRQDNFVIVRSINYFKSGGKKKQMDVLKLELIDGIWSQMEVRMNTEKFGEVISQTILLTESVQFNQDISSHLFSKDQLKRGLRYN